MKSLAKSPGERYATVAEFAEDLQRYRDGLPVRAQPLRSAIARASSSVATR